MYPNVCVIHTSRANTPPYSPAASAGNGAQSRDIPTCSGTAKR